ncbi:MAG: 1-phosphofructokinase family hexose kinase [Betaproteobacteria bacterium]|nr:1-phosphofructokinase family hexose kinase [Betaproteobacteria bacterium]
MLGTLPAVPPLVTLTLQPSLDVAYEVDSLVADRKLHASRYRFDPGGNGINVARALQRLALPAHACLLVAGEIGSLLQRLLAQQVAHVHATRVPGETRINATVEQQRPAAQYEFIGHGPALPAAALRGVLDEVLRLGAGGMVALTGSLPPGLRPTLYAELTRRLQAHGSRVVLDMQGEPLAAAVRRKPYLIKPNRWELEQLVGRALPRLEDVRREAAALVRGGVGHVCVSLGGRGALLACEAGVWRGHAPRVQVQSTVGAGDSMLAGLSCGSGTAAQPGTELFEPAGLLELVRGARVERLGRP